MNKILRFILITALCFCAGNAFPQSFDSEDPDVFSAENRKLFADYLYCEQDYLRAINEYREYLKYRNNDTVKFKIGLALLRMSSFYEAADNFKTLFFNSEFTEAARLENLKSLFLAGNYNALRHDINVPIYRTEKYGLSINKLYQSSFLITQGIPPDSTSFINAFDGEEKEQMLEFYIRKKFPDYKNETTAAILSAVIPGLGKIYADEPGDGITAFIFTGVLGFLAYNNFKNDHDFRGWLFSGLAAYFYAGNIYGSMAAVQNFNAGIRFNFENDFNIYLNKKNYFCPNYEFDCK